MPGSPVHVQELAADHPVRRRRPYEPRSAAITLRGLARLLGERQAERLGEQPVAREDRDVLAEGHVAGRAGRASSSSSIAGRSSWISE